MKVQIPVALSLVVASTLAAAADQLKVNPSTGETQKQFAERTKWWREAKFGMFIHWGVYAIPADGEWHMNTHQMQVKDYEKFVPGFNPTKFDAKAWVKVAKDAGMKYITITSKHHDGFCMFDSKLSDYTITKATPFKRDPLKELAAECQKQGIKLCFYHSIMDWHHPDYLPRRSWETETRPAGNADLNKYIDYMKGQLTELLTGYGKVWGIWFDGGWEHNTTELRSLEVVQHIRKLAPWAMINDRINLPEDYSTPEQTIPAGAMGGGRLWETCMTLNNNWGYARNDYNWKSPTDVIHKLCDIAGKGGNFLLNVGPDETGVIPQPSVENLAEVGKWMKKYGASIYGTTQNMFGKLPFDGRCTMKGKKAYLMVFDWPSSGDLPLPEMTVGVLSAKALTTGETLTVANGVVSKPTKLDKYATVVELQLTGTPKGPVPPKPLKPSGDGSFMLKASDAEVKGGTAHTESHEGIDNIGYWTDPKDAVEWKLEVPAAGNYSIEIEFACPDDEAGSTMSFGPNATFKVPATGAWSAYQKLNAGTLELAKGKQTVRLSVVSFAKGAALNLRNVVLRLK